MYTAFIMSLEDETLYSPATIVNHAKTIGLFPGGLKKEQEQIYGKRVRQAMSRIIKELPKKADGLVKIRGQQHSRAWFGKSWKKVLEW